MSWSITLFTTQPEATTKVVPSKVSSNNKMSIEPWAAKKKPPKVVMKLPKRIPGLVRNKYFQHDNQFRSSYCSEGNS